MKEQKILEILEVMNRTILKLSKNEKISDEELDQLQNTIEALHNEKNLQENNNLSLERRISSVYLKNVPTNLKGYKYLRFAIILTYKGYAGTSITQELYPMVAQKYNVTPAKVERSIRHAIEVGWNNGMGTDENITKMFSVFKNKPTNSHFISAVANDMKLNDI